MGAVVALDCCVSDLKILFGLCGSCGLSMVSLILPAITFVCSGVRLSHGPWHTAGALLVLVSGLVLMFGSTGVIVKGLIA